MIGAVILAAGQSRRMGDVKYLLPWGKLTVIEHIVDVVRQAGVKDIVVVTGKYHDVLVPVCMALGVKVEFNKGYAEGGMLQSFQIGLKSLGEQNTAALLVLGDQPQVQPETIIKITSVPCTIEQGIVVPSYRNRRGHPWMVCRRLWERIFRMPQNSTLRDFLRRYSSEISHVEVDTDTILQDIDTPDDYRRYKPLEG